MAEPVFYDPQRARWKRLRRLVDALVAVLTALVIFFVYTTLRDERLPELLEAGLRIVPAIGAYAGLGLDEKVVAVPMVAAQVTGDGVHVLP